VRDTKKAELRKGLSSRRNPSLMNDAEEILADIKTLWRDLFRNPFDEAKESGLTGPQVTVLACLVTRGPMALTELSRTLSMSHSTASGIVDRLQQRGLLQRRDDAADRRRTAIVVTDNVTQYVRQLEAGPAGRLVAALERATPDQRRMITKGVKTLRKLLDEPID
jgi:DNA-binding MarR family transcriptional regulator